MVERDMSERKNFNIEAYFLGFLALVVAGVIIFAGMTTKFGGSNNASAGTSKGSVTVSNSTTSGSVAANSSQKDVICSCYDAAFKLADQVKRDPTSSAYRTGFSQCRTLGGYEGGAAWTAGWEARISERNYETSCKAYKRRK